MLLEAPALSSYQRWMINVQTALPIPQVGITDAHLHLEQIR